MRKLQAPPPTLSGWFNDFSTALRAPVVGEATSPDRPALPTTAKTRPKPLWQQRVVPVGLVTRSDDGYVPGGPIDVRKGYTLTEVLIATMLVVVLMSACWNLMSLYGSFLKAGRSDVLERQLARSLFQLIEQDARLVNVPTANVPKQPALPSQTPNFAAIETLVSELADVIPTTNETSDPEFTVDATVRFEGTSTSLSITYLAEPVEQPTNIDDELDALRGATDEASDRPGAETRTILYFFNDPEPLTPTDQTLPFGLHRIEASTFDLGSARQQSITDRGEQGSSPSPLGERAGVRGLDAQSANDFTTPNGSTSFSPSSALRAPSLSREKGRFDRLTYDALFQPTDELTRALDEVSGPRFEPIHDHAPEVVRAEFEYFTGEQWVGSWNTANRRSLPTMVRLTLWLVSADELETVRGILDEQALSEEEPETLPGIRPRRYQRTITFASMPLPESDLDGGFE